MGRLRIKKSKKEKMGKAFLIMAGGDKTLAKFLSWVHSVQRKHGGRVPLEWVEESGLTLEEFNEGLKSAGIMGYIRLEQQ